MDIVSEIEHLRQQVQVAWRGEIAPNAAELRKELLTPDTVDLVNFLLSSDVESLHVNPGPLDEEVAGFFPFAGPVCKRYFMKYFLLHALELMKVEEIGQPADSVMLGSLLAYAFDHKYGVAADRRLYTDQQFKVIVDVLTFMHEHPEIIFTGGYTTDMTRKILGSA